MSVAEKETLTWLWCYIEYMGRYPIPTKWEQWMNEPAIGFALLADKSGDLTGVKWSEVKHLATAAALFERLVRDLKSP